MNIYFPHIKLGFLSMHAYRWECVFSAITTCVFIVFQYYLWRAIYLNDITGSITGTFEQTFIYVSLSSVLLSIFTTSIEGVISSAVLSGSIIRDIVRPLNYHLTLLAASCGTAMVRFIWLLIPSLLLIVCLMWSHEIQLNNFILFFLSIILSFFILLHIDLLVGMLAIFTETVWGLRMAKEYIVMALSGALIPLTLLPENVYKVFLLLPFQAICHTPMTILTSDNASNIQIGELLMIQLYWVLGLVVVSSLICNNILNKIRINGG